MISQTTTQLIFKKVNVGSQTYNISGFSRAGLCTSIMISDLDLIFDYGFHDNHFVAINNILISHGHIDHIGSLHYNHNAKKLYNYINPKDSNSLNIDKESEIYRIKNVEI